MKDVLKNLVLLLILVLTSCNVEKGLEPENEVKLSLTEVPFENVKNDSKFKKIFANIHDAN